MPTKDAAGEEIGKGPLKKLKKGFDAHKKVVADLAAKGGAGFLEGLKAEIAADQAALDACGEQ